MKRIIDMYKPCWPFIKFLCLCFVALALVCAGPIVAGVIAADYGWSKDAATYLSLAVFPVWLIVLSPVLRKILHLMDKSMYYSES